MKIERLFIYCFLAGTSLLASCSGEDMTDSDARLPDGKYSMTFTAGVEGQTASKASTRATVDNTWTGTEEVAVQVGSEVKKYTAATDNVLTAHDSNEPFYWQSTTETKSVQAWYPWSATRPESFTVQGDQNGDGYQQSDMLYTSQSISYSSATTPGLTFRHLPAKVVVNLKAGTAVTADEVAGATVSLVNQSLTSGAINADGAVAQIATGSATITPKIVAPASAAYQQTVQALVVPQQMQGKRFIKVTIGSGNYYYTPANDDANLTAGQQYTYDITVNRAGVTATVSVTEWENTPAVNPDAEMGDAEVRKPLDQAEMGDFYCVDGFGAYLIPKDVAELTDAQKASCLGIVMKVGKDGDGDWKDDCSYMLKDGTTPMPAVHGYVLALYDANNGNTCKWGSYGTQVGHDDMNRERYTGFYGYKNTQAIKAFNGNAETLTNYPAAYWASVDYEKREEGKYAAPGNSSGWFLPSAGQCWYWYNNRDFLLAQVKKATGDNSYGWKSWYWSSSEYDLYPSSSAGYLNFSYGRVDVDYKNSGNYVRSCLAF